jgi:acetyl esterase/lipase
MKTKVLRAMLMGLLVAMMTGCSPLKMLNALTPSSTFTKTAGVAYGNDPRNKLDVYTPVDHPAHAPVVVFFYGGSWNSGSRMDYDFVGEALASRGVVVVVADYRLYPQVRYPAFLEDSARAVAWAHEHAQDYGGDPGRLYVMGHSSGAYNAAMVALDPTLLAAVGLKPSIISGWIGLAGPYDFLPVDVEAVKPVFFFPHSPPESQPINHVSRDSPPALLLASKDDSYVNPTRNTAGMAARLREDGVPVRELYFSRTNHATLVGAFSRPLRSLAPVLDDVVDFIHADLHAQQLSTQ